MLARLALTGWGATPLLVTLFLLTIRELDALKDTPHGVPYRWVMGVALGAFMALSVGEVLLQVTAHR